MQVNSNAAAFAKRMHLRKVQADRSMREIFETVFLSVDRAVVQDTPVDTGRARSNWVASVGVPSLDFLKVAYSPGKRLGRSETANAQAAVGQAQAALAGRKPGETAFLCNNAPYIGKLNNGSSTQAPQLFIQKAIQAGVASVRGVKIFK